MTRADKLFSPFPFTRSKGALYVYDLKIRDVVTDPMAANIHTVYVCVKTPLSDGHAHASLAYANGCRCFVAARGLGLPEDAAVYTTEDPEAYLGELAARCFGYPARSLTVVGVVGEQGKTSVAYTLASLLKSQKREVATLTSDGTDVGDTFTPLGAVAPNAADIERMLYAARRKGTEVAIVELSSYMIAHRAEKSIPFAALLLTIPTLNENLQELLSIGAPLVFVPKGTPEIKTKGRLLYYGSDGDVAFENARTQSEGPRLGTAFSLAYETERVEAFYPVLGDFGTHNATAAAALALALGLSLHEIAASLAKAAPTGRVECILSQNGKRVFLDTAYKAQDLSRVLAVLRTVTTGKLSVLLGSVGGRAVARRAPLGLAAANGADLAYFTADDPDGEPPLDVIRDMVSEIADASRYLVIPERDKAILRACAELRPGDTLLILTKARDHTQLVSGVKREFCDRDAVKKAVERG